VHPCQPTHRRIKSRASYGDVCVECELVSWRAVVRSTVSWNVRAHLFLKRCLGSYRGYATAPQRLEMNRMMGEGFYRETLQAVTSRQLRAQGIAVRRVTPIARKTVATGNRGEAMTNQWETRPAKGYAAPGLRPELLARLGGPCDGCGMAPPIREARHIVSGRALCEDCYAERRMNRIAARIHHR